MTSSFSTQADAVPVVASISSVNLEGQTATGYTANAGNIPIDFSLMPGGIYTVPKIGEQWVCRRTGRNAWQLMTQLPFQDERLNLDPEEGMTVIGRAGPTIIKGDRVEVPDEFYIAGKKYVESAGGAAASSIKSARFQIPSNSDTPYTFNNFLAIPYSVMIGSGALTYYELNRSGDALGSIRIKRAGEYRIDLRAGVVNWQTVNSPTLFNVLISVNGTTIAYRSGVNYVQDSTHAVMQETTQTIPLAINDRINASIYAAQSGKLSVGAAYQNQLTISFVG